MKQSCIYGLVLAGGRSSRMGEDKGLLRYHNKPQREYLFDLLGQFCAHVFTSCRKEQGVREVFNPVYDKFDFESPLNGILSAFETDSSKAWLAVAVDMPHVNNEVLRFLISHRDTTKVATCFYDSEGKLPEPLLTLWEPSSFALLTKYKLKGGISPRKFLVQNEVRQLTYPDAQIHVNVNTPDDYKRLTSQ